MNNVNLGLPFSAFLGLDLVVLWEQLFEKENLSNANYAEMGK